MQYIQENNYLSEELFINDCVTKDGLQFNPNLNVWIFSDISNNTRFDFTKLDFIDIDIYGIKRTFIWYLENKSTAIRFNDPSSDIIDPKVDPSCKAMGKCGTYSFCSLSAPLACYTCNSFQAWVDGPHEKLLEYLIKERKELLKTTDYRIASINDKTILAVAQVILECRKYKEENTQELIV